VTGRSPLHLAGIYERRVNASLARIWENVFDWEHLAHLHDGTFADCVLMDRGLWGWQVMFTPLDGRPHVIELRADRANGRYTSTTLEGPGAGTEIRVTLKPVSAEAVDVLVAFHLPEGRPDRLHVLGEAYSAIYARLWDEDEAMMLAREKALSRPLEEGEAKTPLDLGDETAVRASLPLMFEKGRASYRLVELGSDLIAHAIVCPHWLGPLDEAPVSDGKVRCPWHGYRFDIVSQTCVEHPKLRLAPAPVIRIMNGRVIAGELRSCGYRPA
jgi:nitrite reductase/ring-hydroxylating ferredoxin subunit